MTSGAPRSPDFLSVAMTYLGALTLSKSLYDESLAPEPACATTKVPFILAPADITFSTETYWASDVVRQPEAQRIQQE